MNIRADPSPAGPGDAGPSVLSRLISLNRDEFAAHHWGRTALLSVASDLGGGFRNLLDAAAIDELVSERGLRTPFLRVAKDGTTLADRAFTAPGGVGAGIGDQVSDDKLLHLFAEGATLVLQALHRMWPPVIAFCGSLAGELGHPVQANAYVTPPQNQGFAAHYDVHDVFVLQIEGEKHWRVHAPVWEAPLRDQPWSDRKPAVAARARAEPLIDAVLRPGDCLYLPRGFLHSAKALGGISTHLTIGVHVWTRYALAEQFVQAGLQALAQDPALRAALPLGADFDDPSTLRADAETARGAAIDALRRVDLEALAAQLRSAQRATARAAPVGPLRQLRDAADLAADTPIVLRPQSAARVERLGARTVLRSRSGDLGLAEEDVAPVAALVSGGSRTASELGLELARRLLLSGHAVVG